MGEIILDGAGSGYVARVTPEGRLMVDLSGVSLYIGSVSASVDSIYVESGNVYSLNQIPTSGYNPQTVLVYSGTAIGSIYKIDANGSILKVLSYDGSDNLVNISSWIGV
jgi:hypothetical protein